MRESILTYCAGLLKSAGKIFVTLGLARRSDPVTSPEDLRRFVEQRSKYMAQTTLYGYLKTRAGTRYVSLFEDDVFVESINIAKWEIYLACVSDLTVYAAARLGHTAGASAEEMTAIASQLVTALCDREDEAGAAFRPRFDKARDAFRIRAAGTDWSAVDDREAAFSRSPQALVDWAPVAPQLKEFDTEIVVNSMRFKWKYVRDEARTLMRGHDIIRIWRMEKGAGAGSGE